MFVCVYVGTMVVTTQEKIYSGQYVIVFVDIYCRYLKIIGWSGIRSANNSLLGPIANSYAIWPLFLSCLVNSDIAENRAAQWHLESYKKINIKCSSISI